MTRRWMQNSMGGWIIALPALLFVEPASADIDSCFGEQTAPQWPAYQAQIISQVDDLNPEYGFGQAADGFRGDGTFLAGVAWWGQYWPAEIPPDPPEAFRIQIYRTDELGCPTDLLWSQDCTNYVETFGNPGFADYCCNFDWPFFFKEDGAYYSLSIQAITPGYMPDRWWYWFDGNLTGDGVSGCYRDNDEYQEWTRFTDVFGFGFDMGFIQLSLDPVDVEETNGQFHGVTTRAWPVPSSGNISIEWRSDSSKPTVLSIYTAEGRSIYERDMGTLAPGTHVTEWNGRGNDGDLVPTGVYFYKMRIGSLILQRKLQILR